MSKCLSGLISFLFALHLSADNVKTIVLKPTYQRSFTESVAIFEYLSGNKEQAMLELAQDSGTALGDIKNTNRNLYRMEQLQQALESNLSAELPIEISNDMWLDISEMRRQQGDCQGALAALFELKNLNIEMDHRQRFQRVTCMLRQHSLSKAMLAAAETQVLQAEGQSMWLAYIYNNIAVAAQSIDEQLLAQEYFQRAISFTDDSDEGESLASYLKINLAYSYFSENRFDYALSTFSDIPEDTEWLDLGLLGFGWAAYKNNKAGLALEAWRQLVRLPFKSINVYEGYIAIPFALEKQNAYAEALIAYQAAIDKYELVVHQIDELSEKVTQEDIHRHAIDYKQSMGKEVNPLHPLLVHAYSQGSFQDVFDTIGLTAHYLKKLEDLEGQLFTLAEIRTKKLSQVNIFQEKLLEKERLIEQQINKIENYLISISRLMIDDAFLRFGQAHDLYDYYQGYKRLDKYHDKSDLIDKAFVKQIKGVLIGRLHEENELFYLKNENTLLLTQRYEKINTEYQAYLKTKKELRASDEPDKQIQSMQAKLQIAKDLVSQVQFNAEKLLLDKTLESLLQQKKQLRAFESQARLAATRLSEEFYQKGGQRLWH